MDKEYIGLIGALAGVALAGGLGLLKDQFSFAREQRQKRREQRLRHFEEIFDCLDKIDWALTMFYLSYAVSLLQGKTEPPKGITEMPLARLELLVRLYCPQFEGSLQKLRIGRDQCGQHFVEAVKCIAVKDDQGKMREIQFMILQSQAVSKECEAFKKSVIELSREDF